MDTDLYRIIQAEQVARKSKARRLKVGCVITFGLYDLGTYVDKKFITDGYNHMPEGFDDNCEDELPDGTLVTKKELIHAEEDAITKAAKFGYYLNNATLYVTHSPCINCAKLIVQSGIKRVVYHKQYRLTDGIDFLKKCNIEVIKIK